MLALALKIVFSRKKTTINEEKRETLNEKDQIKFSNLGLRVTFSSIVVYMQTHLNVYAADTLKRICSRYT